MANELIQVRMAVTPCGANFFFSSYYTQREPSLARHFVTTPPRGPRLNARQFGPQGLVIAQQFLTAFRRRHAAADFNQGDAIIAGLAEQTEQLAVRIRAGRILVEFIDVT